MNDSPVRLLSVFRGGALKRGAAFGLILLIALFAFEVFNYSTTEFALNDMLGSNLRFIGIRWATILSIAFCGIDFAGIARLFTPQEGREQPAEVWYLFGAWLMAAAMNAVLTWWGVSLAIRSHQELSSAVVSPATLIKMVPIFVALMVWLIRVLIIGTFSMAGDRIFSLGLGHSPMIGNTTRARLAPRQQVQTEMVMEEEEEERPRPQRPMPSPQPASGRPAPVSRPEPTYHPVGLAARSARERDNGVRR